MKSIKWVYRLSTWIKSLVAALVICSTWVIILFAIGLTRVESEIEHYLTAHSEDLELAVTQGDMIAIQGIFSGLQRYGVENSLLVTNIFSGGKAVSINSGKLGSSFLTKAIFVRLQSNGLELGRVDCRISYGEILKKVIRYDLHILAIILISNLLIFIGFNFLIQSEIFLLNRALIMSITDFRKADQLINNRTLLSKLVLSNDFGITIRNLICEVAKLRKAEVDRSALDVEKALARQVAHDIRSPLSAINMIMDKISGSKEVLELLRNSLNRISGTTNDLLKKSKSTNQLVLTPQTIKPQVMSIDLKTVCYKIEHLVKEARFRFPWVDITFVSSLKDFEKLEVDVDILVRILSILLDNSLDSLVGDHAFIRVSASCESSMLKISVSDSGIGIRADLLERLGKETITIGKANGNGLGLYYAHQATCAMGGQLKIKSRQGIGTTVELTFGMTSNINGFSELTSADK